MLNLFNLIQELRDMNESLTARLEEIIERLDKLISLKEDDFYGDGR